ncbi:MAG: hypothetical protein R2752_18990 [Vicinamibacterales bacterium]
MGPTIDREKVLTVLLKRFPEARLCDVAAAANAIVGLDPEYDVVSPAQLDRLECDAGGRHFTARHVVNGDLRIYHRVK